MFEYKFRNPEDIEDLLIREIGMRYLIEQKDVDGYVFFHNGDKMTVFPDKNLLLWDPINPGEMFTSRMSMKIHQWFGKGIIYKVHSEEVKA